MYFMIWSYSVDKPKQKSFEEEYSRSGSWFKFFEPCNDYLGHDLIKNIDGKSYVVIDKWMSKQSQESFVASHQIEYNDLNVRSKELYDAETSIGSYESIA